MLSHCGAGEDSWESLGQQGDQPAILMYINPEYSLEERMLKLQYCGHLMQRANSLEKILILGNTEGKRRWGNRGWDGWWHHQLNGHEFEQIPGNSKGQGSLVCCNPWGHKELDMTWWLNNNSNLGFGWIHFALIFVYGMRKCFNFILVHLAGCPVFPAPLVEETVLVHCIFLPPLLH